MGRNLQYSTLVLLMLVFFLGLIRNVFQISGWKFVLELVIVVGLILFALMAVVLMYNNLTFGYVLSSFVSGVALINLVAIYFKNQNIMTTMLFVGIVASITAFVISIINMGEKPMSRKRVVLKTYTPGKVVASKSGKNYHAPKCEWAKKIKKGNRVWYKSVDEAKKAKLKPHSCLK